MHFCFYFEKKILLVRNFTFSVFSRFSSSNFSSNCSNFLNYCIGYFINCVVMIVLKLFSIQVYNVHANLTSVRNIDMTCTQKSQNEKCITIFLKMLFPIFLDFIEFHMAIQSDYASNSLYLFSRWSWPRKIIIEFNSFPILFREVAWTTKLLVQGG